MVAPTLCTCTGPLAPHQLANLSPPRLRGRQFMSGARVERAQGVNDKVHSRCPRCSARVGGAGDVTDVHDVERPVGEAQHRKSAKRAFATKGRKFASLTSDFIQFPRQHEPRRARHGSPGGARAPRMPSSRQSTGTGTAARACAPDKDCKQPRRLRQGIDTPVTSATSAPRRL